MQIENELTRIRCVTTDILSPPFHIACNRVPFQQRISTLHIVPLSLSARYTPVVMTSADQTADTMPTKGRNWTLVLNANGLAGMEKKVQILPTWWNMLSPMLSSSSRHTCIARCTTRNSCHPATIRPYRRTGTNEGMEYLL